MSDTLAKTLMTSVLFIQDLFYQNMGPMYVSAALKRAGHRCRMLLTNRPEGVVEHLEGVDVVAFSCTTGAHITALALAERIKAVKPEIFIIMGGAHPTFYPEVLIKTPHLDAICRGEGESPMAELCDLFPDREAMAQVRNIHMRLGDDIHANPMRELDDIDALPYPDRDLYGALFDDSVHPVLASRGCPYNCTFCFNNSFRNELKRDTEKGYSVRYRDPEGVIRELERLGPHASRIQFRDESFLSSLSWVRSFLSLYRDRIGLPFTCQVRINEVSEEKARLLKEANVHCVYFGIESGNEAIRQKVINKKLRNEQIIQGAEILKRHGIPFRTYNMIGFPDETVANVHETIRINQAIGSDYPWVSLLMPYRGTEIYQHYDEHYADDDVADLEWFFPKSSYYRDKTQHVNMHNLFLLYVKFPRLQPMLDRLTGLPPNGLFRLLYKLTYAWSSFRSEGYTLRDFLRRGLRLSFGSYSFGPHGDASGTDRPAGPPVDGAVSADQP